VVCGPPVGEVFDPPVGEVFDVTTALASRVRVGESVSRASLSDLFPSA